jgi:hypothetical protein
LDLLGVSKFTKFRDVLAGAVWDGVMIAASGAQGKKPTVTTTDQLYAKMPRKNLFQLLYTLSEGVYYGNHNAFSHLQAVDHGCSALRNIAKGPLEGASGFFRTRKMVDPELHDRAMLFSLAFRNIGFNLSRDWTERYESDFESIQTPEVKNAALYKSIREDIKNRNTPTPDVNYKARKREACERAGFRFENDDFNRGFPFTPYRRQRPVSVYLDANLEKFVDKADFLAEVKLAFNAIPALIRLGVEISETKRAEILSKREQLAVEARGIEQVEDAVMRDAQQTGQAEINKLLEGQDVIKVALGITI